MLGFNKIKKGLEGDIVGVDIGTSSIKVVQLTVKENKVIFKNFAIARLRSGTIQATDQLLAGKQISSILSLALNKSEIKGKKVSFAIPAFSSFISFVTLSGLYSSEEELASKIEIEARKYIPVPIEEVVLGWEKIIDKEGNKSLTGMKAKKEQELKILLIAVAKDTIEKYETIAGMSNIDLGSIEIETFSLIRCLIGDDKGSYLIIDMGYKICNVVIVANGFLRGSRNIDVGGSSITDAISKGMEVDKIRSEVLKKELGMTDPRLANLITPALGRIVQEAVRILEDYNSKNPSRKVKKAFIVGGSAKLKGLKEYLKMKLGIEIEEGDPWKRVQYDVKYESILRSFQDELTVALGVAMKKD
jgi:type IV pilus assembly protein PilM